MGLLSGLTSAYLFRNAGWQVWQWPIISCLWIISSWVQSYTIEDLKKQRDKRDTDFDNVRDELYRTQMEMYKSQFGNAQK